MPWSLFKSAEVRAQEERDFQDFQNWVDSITKRLTSILASFRFRWPIPYRALCQVFHYGMVAHSIDEHELGDLSIPIAQSILNEGAESANVQIVSLFAKIYPESKCHIWGRSREKDYLVKGLCLSGTEDVMAMVQLGLFLFFSLREAQKKGTFERKKEEIIIHYSLCPKRMGEDC